MIGDRDAYTDGLVRRLGPPLTLQDGRRRGRVLVLTRMPTKYELEASRAAVARQRRVLDGIGILLAIVGVALIAWILLK